MDKGMGSSVKGNKLCTNRLVVSSLLACERLYIKEGTVESSRDNFQICGVDATEYFRLV